MPSKPRTPVALKSFSAENEHLPKALTTDHLKWLIQNAAFIFPFLKFKLRKLENVQIQNISSGAC